MVTRRELQWAEVELGIATRRMAPVGSTPPAPDRAAPSNPVIVVAACNRLGMR